MKGVVPASGGEGGGENDAVLNPPGLDKVDHADAKGKGVPHALPPARRGDGTSLGEGERVAAGPEVAAPETTGTGFAEVGGDNEGVLGNTHPTQEEGDGVLGGVPARGGKAEGIPLNDTGA